MLAYYPLEHLYYLVSHSIIPSEITLPSLASLLPFSSSEAKGQPLSLDAGVLSRTSTRLWALYVFLQLAHLREDQRLLTITQRSLSKSKVGILGFITRLSGELHDVFVDSRCVGRARRASQEMGCLLERSSCQRQLCPADYTLVRR